MAAELVGKTLVEVWQEVLPSERVALATLTVTWDGIEADPPTLITLGTLPNLEEGDLAEFQAFVDGLDEITADAEAIIVYQPV
jgi:hypothetical protein